MYSSDNTISVAPRVAAWLLEHKAVELAGGGSVTQDLLVRSAVAFSYNAYSLDGNGTRLFDLGSKFPHSCMVTANTILDENNDHIALANIAAGDILYANYRTHPATMLRALLYA